MSSGGQGPAPSRMNLQILRQKRKGANQGYNLLKRKSDAMTAKFRGMLKEIVKTKLEIGSALSEAHFSLAKASWAGGADFKTQLIQRVKRPGLSLSAVYDNIAGVRLPNFQIETDPSVDWGPVILAARDAYTQALAALVKLASLQTAFFTLDEEIKMTNRRVNALNNVVLPRLDGEINFVSKELDEMEREEFFRLKKIQEKKKDQKKHELEAISGSASRKDAAGTSNSIFGNEDDDLVF